MAALFQVILIQKPKWVLKITICEQPSFKIRADLPTKFNYSVHNSAVLNYHLCQFTGKLSLISFPTKWPLNEIKSSCVIKMSRWF